MFTLAHISDIHLAPLPQPRFWDLCSKRIIGYINWKYRRANSLNNEILTLLTKEIRKHSPDHLVITGDIVNLALKSEFAQARDWLASLGDRDKISLTLGNHDAYVRGAFKEACHYFKPWLKDDGDFAFPYCQIRQNIALIAVSSALATPPFCALGYVSAKERQRLALLLRQMKNYFRIILIHHPPIRGANSLLKKLYPIKALEKILRKEGAELILHGHNHCNSLAYLAGPNGQQIPVIGVSAAGQAFDNKHEAASYNYFLITKHGPRDKAGQANAWQCQFTNYQLNQKGQFIALKEKLFLYNS